MPSANVNVNWSFSVVIISATSSISPHFRNSLLWFVTLRIDEIFWLQQINVWILFPHPEQLRNQPRKLGKTIELIIFLKTFIDNLRGKHARSLEYRLCKLGKTWKTRHKLHKIESDRREWKLLICHWCNKLCTSWRLNLTMECRSSSPRYVDQHLDLFPEY